MPRHTRPNRDTARSHAPDVPRAIAAPAASSLVPAALPRPWMFFNRRLAPAHQYARSGQASQVAYSAIPPPMTLITWRHFLRTQAASTLAVEVDSRYVHILGVTEHSDGPWTTQQIRTC